MSLFSRYAKETFVYTGPKRDLSKFVRDVNRYCREFDTDSVFPTSEAAIMACSRYRNELARIPIIPQEQEIETLFSKARTLGIAQSLGIAVPKTVHITQTSSLATSPIGLRFPVVIKSESSEVMLSKRAATSEKTTYVANENDLRRECESRLAKGQSVLLQEFIDGYGVGISGLFAEGRPVALLGHRRIRESDPLGGPSAVAETIELEPRLLHATTTLLAAIGFTGPAMTEYKVDRRTGQAYLMEINGRFWGTVLLAPVAGLDLPYLYWKMLNGIDIWPEETCYRVGVRGRYLVGDTKCLFLSLKGKPKNWPGEFAKRGSAIRSYLRSFVDERTTDLLLTRDDPMPFVARLIQDLA
jgi:predicted ATP-grasp superfamily ATP-dependent carboligase